MPGVREHTGCYAELAGIGTAAFTRAFDFQARSPLTDGSKFHVRHVFGSYLWDNWDSQFPA
jgi:hypothetical protein